ncbi:MAG: DNA (cytosine-5-)-methyltransferase [Chloroflexi bacterium]|nr:DNA (cytosine-5-)-methyltransferase [Chloroflexota bacterium]
MRRGERIVLEGHPGSPDQDSPEAIRHWLDDLPRPWAVDLYSGAGGLSLGLQDAGFSIVAAADFDSVAMETHKANIPSLAWVGDLSNPDSFIDQLDTWGIENVDLLAGGPPCQPFSRAGTAKIGNLVKSGNRPAHDERADLWQSFFSILDRLTPRAMLFENVPDFAQAQGGALLISLLDELKDREYRVHVQELKAWQYGVPQHRSRLFVIAIESGLEFHWPKPASRRPTVWQAIGDLPEVPPDTRQEVHPYEGHPTTKLARDLRRGLRGAETKSIRDHITRAVRPDDAAIYRRMMPGDTYRDVPNSLRRYRSDIFNDKYFRLSFEDVSRTITAHIAKDGYWYIHPAQDRTLSIREAARIQTFPDRFRFAGYPTNRFRQIGNAVPPFLARAIAVELRRSLDGEVAIAGVRERQPDYGSAFRRGLISWFNRHGRRFPWRSDDLSPWQFLVVEMCLHRTKADQVARVIQEVLALGKTPKSFLLNRAKIEPYIATLGLRWRSANLAAAAEYIQSKHDGRVPDRWPELTAVPGVGNYIASAMQCFAFDRTSVLVDTNTRRIARRVHGNDAHLPPWRIRLHLHELAGDEGANVPWNQALLDLGALVCKSRSPACVQCPVKAHCVTGRKKLAGTERRD